MSTVFTSTAGKRISEYRKIKGLSQQQLSDLLGVSRSYLGDIEAQRSEPSTNFLTAITAKTDVSCDWLLTGEGEMYRTKTMGIQETPAIYGEGFIERRKNPPPIGPNAAKIAKSMEGLTEEQQISILEAIEEKKRLNRLEEMMKRLEMKAR